MARLAAILILSMGVTAAGAGVSATVVPDRVFNGNIDSALNSPVFGVAIQSDGKIVVGGDFSSPSVRLSRFNANGTPDAAFNSNVVPALNDRVWDVAVQSDGKIVVFGFFTSPSRGLARFNANGTLDTTFNNNVGNALNGSVWGGTIQSDGKILVGGEFTSPSKSLARFNDNGFPDSAFNAAVGTAFYGVVEAFAVQSDGKIVVGGSFTSPTLYLARINSNGTQDTAFNGTIGTALNYVVPAVAIQSDGKVVVGGYFSTPSLRVARFNANGSPDTTFNGNVGTGSSVAVNSIALQSNGKIVVGRDLHFSSPTHYLERLNADGTPDTTFNDSASAAFNSSTKVVAVQSDGAILVGGYSTTLSAYLTRFMPPCGAGIALTTSPTALWQQLSLPCKPNASATTVGAVLGGNASGQLDGANYGTRWSLWKRNAANNGNLQMALADTFGIGTGHWIQSLDAPVGGKLMIDDSLSRPTPLTGVSGCQSSEGCVVLPVASATAAARMIANPFPHDVDWSKVAVRVGGAGGPAYFPSVAQAAGYLSNTIWIWNGNTYATWSDANPTKGNLQYFKSFFVKVLPGGVGRTIDLLIPALASTVATTPGTFLTQAKGAVAAQTTSPFDARTSAVAPVRPPVRPPSRPTSWVVDLGVLNPDTGWSAVAKLGQWQGAETAYDPGDLSAMAPFAQPYLTIVFPHADWGTDQAGDYTTDLRPANGFAGKWDFEVRAEPLNTTAVLRWNADAAVLAKSRLIDRDTGAVMYPTDPNFAGGYPMTLTTPVRRLTWEYMGN